MQLTRNHRAYPGNAVDWTPPLDARRSALRCLRAVVHALRQSARSVERRTGVTNAQLFILRQLAAASALSVNEITERVRTQQSTVSSVVTRLKRAGLVTRTRDPADARRAVLSITTKGRQLLRRAPLPPTEGLISALAALSPTQVRALAAGLTALTRNLRLSTSDAPLLFEEALPAQANDA